MNSSPEPPSRSWTAVRKRGRMYVVLLALLLSSFVAIPLFADSPHRVLAAVTLGSLIFLAAIACLEAGSFRWMAFRWIGAAAVVSGWIPLVSERPVLLVIAAGLRIAFFAIVTGALIYQVAMSKTVTGATIVGAIDGYLLLGFMAAAAFTIEALVSGGVRPISGAVAGDPDMIYFAFITLATVGYGDILPATPAARSLAVVVALSRQLYVAVLIALLVGKYSSAGVSGER